MAKNGLMLEKFITNAPRKNANEKWFVQTLLGTASECVSTFAIVEAQAR